MTACPACGQPIDASSAQCPHCQAGADEGRSRPASESEQQRPPAKSAPEPEQGPSCPTPRKRRLPVGPILVAVVAVAAIISVMTPRSFPDLALPPAAGSEGAPDPCAQTERCLVVYLAPWCAACQKSGRLVGVARDLLAGSPVGVKVVVGMDQPAALQEMAATLGAGVYLDADGALWKAIGASGVPHWFSVHKGRIDGDVSGAYPSAREQLDDLGLLPFVRPAK